MPFNTDVHPDYEAAPPEMRWRSGGLEGLFLTLRKQAERRGGAWEKRVLRGGAFVGCRKGPYGLELRFYRRDPFKTEDGPALWDNEIVVFRRQMGVADWEEIESPAHYPGPIRTYREPARLL